MGDSGGLEVSPVSEAGRTGDLSLECKVQGGERDSPKIRRSERKRPLRSIAGHLLKSRPKSPLMRMAEMRRGGLRGGALRLSNMKGSVSSERKANGRKGADVKGSKALASIPESEDLMTGGLEGRGEEVCAEIVAYDGGALTAEDLGGRAEVEVPGGVDGGLEEGSSSIIPADKMLDEMSQEAVNLGVPQKLAVSSMSEVEERSEGLETSMLFLTEVDSALDLCEAQPLQNMSFLVPKDMTEGGESALKLGSGNGNGNGVWAIPGEALL